MMAELSWDEYKRRTWEMVSRDAIYAYRPVLIEGWGKGPVVHEWVRVEEYRRRDVFSLARIFGLEHRWVKYFRFKEEELRSYPAPKREGWRWWKWEPYRMPVEKFRKRVKEQR